MKPYLKTVGMVVSLLALFASIPAMAKSKETLAASFSKERLGRIDRVLQEYIDNNKLAGAVALVLQDGKSVYEKAFGYSDKEAQRKMTIGTMFRIASQTKAITSAAALILFEEGKISLDDPVSLYIPAFAETSVGVVSDKVMSVVPAKRPITLRDLLTHTSGISYGAEPELDKLYATKGLGRGVIWRIMDLDEPVCTTIERLATLPFAAQPGETWTYGYSTDVLGCVIERASGMALNEFIRTKITDPLGMKDTTFFLSPTEQEKLAAVYVVDAAGLIGRAPDGPGGQGTFVNGPKVNFAGGAGLLSTAKDYARFLEMIRRGGSLDGVRILAPRTVALMATNQVGNLHSPNGLGFGLGFETTDRFGAKGMESVGSFGWGGAYGTTYRVDREAKLVMVLMLQLIPRAPVRDKFPAMVYQALMDPFPKPM